MIPTMSGLARPEILATTEWLAENLGKFGIRVLDLRWRPDGSAPAVHAAGHIPGAALVDWRTDLIDEGESGEAIVLAGPDRMAALAVRAGITDDTTVVVYDDTQSLFAARAWWSLRAYGLDSVRDPRRRLPGLGRPRVARSPTRVSRRGRPGSRSAARTGPA